MKNSQPFDVITSKSVLAGETKLLWDFKVPQNAVVKITNMGNTIDEPEAWGYVYWTLKRNGVGVHPYDKLIDQIGYGALLKEISIDDFQGGDLIEVYATNNYIDTLDVGLLLKVVLE